MNRKSLVFFFLLFSFTAINFVYAAPVASFTHNHMNSTAVVGFPILFVSTSTGATSYAWDFDNNGTTDATGQTEAFTFTSAGTYTVKLTVTDGETSDFCTMQIVIKSWVLELKSVGFMSVETNPVEKWHVIYRDVAQTAYSDKPDEPFNDNPQWQDNSDPLNGNATDSIDKKYPICYTSGSTMKVKVILEGRGPVPTPILVKGENTDGFNFGGANGTEITYTSAAAPNISTGYIELDCEKSFDDDKVKYWANLGITWKAKPNGCNWLTTGVSENETYITWQDPTTGTYELSEMYHTLVHIACSNANNQTTEANIISNIWNDFTDKIVLRREDSEPLKYYNPWNTQNTETYQLIYDANGQCHSWAMFFIDVLKVHDIHNDDNLYRLEPTDGSDKFIVHTWDYDANPICYVNNYPYSNIQNKNSATAYEWFYQDVTDHSGVEGQSSNNPRSFFNRHYICCIGGAFYDPSYGNSFASIITFEESSISGYSKKEYHNVNEYVIDVDLNNNNDKNDVVNTDVDGFKTNPSGNQLTTDLYSTK